MTIRLLALDVDGVLTDGKLYYTAAGEEMKVFHVADGLGLKLLARLGVEIAVISGRGSAALDTRLDDLGIYHRRLKCADKVAGLMDICADIGIEPSAAAFMGDDLVDLKVMRMVGLALAPASAEDAVKAAAHWVGQRAGGHGAVREACDHIANLMGTSLADVAAGGTQGLVQ